MLAGKEAYSYTGLPSRKVIRGDPAGQTQLQPEDAGTPQPQTFGLFAVDRTTMKRHPMESLNVLGSYRR